jgi:dUTP pyrophosphatase
MNCLRVHIQREPGCEDLPLPEYQTDQSAGLDLYAAVDEAIEISPGEVRLISTGIRLAIPSGYEAQIRPRSGLALHSRIGILNSPGTIDADYRGVVGVILVNFGREPFVVKRGDRIAQMVFSKVERVALEEVPEIKGTERGDGGFGHTGTRPPK